MNKFLPLLLIPFFFTISFAQEPKVEYKDGDGFRDCLVDGTPVWRHMNAYDDSTKESLHDTYKTFHHVFANDGKSFITKGAGGKFTHHRGLYLGWSKVKSASSGGDFWHCKGVSIRLDSYDGDTSVNAWVDKNGKTIVKDYKTVTTSILEDGTVQLDFDIKIESHDGDVQLNGDPQHAGFQFRAHNGVTSKHATYTRPEGAENKGNDVWVNCPWCVNTFELDGTAYSVTHMTHPENPAFKDTVYSTRNYGRFGSYAKTTLKADEPLHYKFRVRVSSKAPTVESAQAAYDAWLK